jgi:2-polyprenyl-6-methoxyphenol hydroxylase-like FAD-dependent oxidoreductase
VERRVNDQFDAYYQDMVQILRDLIPPATPFVTGKVARISTTSDRQHLVLSNGDEIAARLVVLATGLNHALRTSLGIERVTISAMHSISVGFDMAPAGPSSFDFPALDYYPEQISERIAYLTLFPIGSRMRANLFAYRGIRDPWFQELRKDPAAVLFAAMPGLKKITGDFTAASDVQIRPVDLYRCTNTRQPGVVLVGDAFATSCPAAGTGLDKAFTDVERLCNVHIPQWLASPGMGAEKVGDFYDDPVKRACDAESESYAFEMRSLSTELGPIWRLRRGARFAFRLALGTLRSMSRSEREAAEAA